MASAISEVPRLTDAVSSIALNLRPRKATQKLISPDATVEPLNPSQRKHRSRAARRRRGDYVHSEDPSLQKRPAVETIQASLQKKPKRDLPRGAQLASRFGDLSSMAYDLRHAIESRRQQKEDLPIDFTARWKASMVRLTPFTSLRTRFLRAELAEEWLAIVRDGQPMTEKQLIAPRLNISLSDNKGWDNCRKLKSRFSTWAALCRMFESELGVDSVVAICGFVGCNSKPCM